MLSTDSRFYPPVVGRQTLDPTVLPSQSAICDYGACPAGTGIMELRHLRARIERLNQLLMGLGREHSHWLKCDAPVYLWEREQYRKALTEAIRAVDAVRRVLVKVCSRIEKGE